MRFRVAAFIGLLINGCSEGNKIQPEDDNLTQNYGPVIFVNLLYRHGDRTISTTYNTDPHRNSSLWAKGFSQLTQEGQERQYILGKWIRKRYPDLVGDEYDFNNIFVRSSDHDRCLMSAQCTMAGIYPAKQGFSVPFQPIPIHSVMGADKMLVINVFCPSYIKDQRDLMSSSFIVNKNRELKNLYDILSKYTGEEINTMLRVAVLHDTLNIQEKQMNLTLPEWTKCCYPEPMWEVRKLAYSLLTFTDTMRRIKAGPLLYEMVNHIASKAEGSLKPNRKMWVYSAHDHTLIAILDALRLWRENYRIPSYASLLAMELRQKEEEHYVTVLYKVGEEDSVKLLKMPGCFDGVCTLNEFLDNTSSEALSEEDWNKLCYGTQIEASGQESYYVVNNTSDKVLGWLLYISLGIFFCPPVIFGLNIFIKPKKKVMNKYQKLISELQ